MAAVSSGNVGRKTLADISNFQVEQVVRDLRSRSSTTVKDYEQLLKEKMQLMKILADRQKIIEVTGIELQKLRINQQKMQEQNKLLAQSNRQLLAEINASSEKVRALNHDLGCKNGLLKALQRELKSKVKVNVSEEEVKLTGTEDCEVAARGQDADKQDTSSSRIYSKSMGPSLQVQSKAKAGNKRACVRRQSARFKSDSGLEDGAISIVTTVKDEDKEGNVAINICMDEDEVKLMEIDVPRELAAKGLDAGKQDTFNRRNNSRSLGPSSQALSKELSGNKRTCVRRQSARFKSEEAESTDEFCQLPEAKFAVKLTETELPGGLTTTDQDADKQGTSTRINQSKSLISSHQFQSHAKAGKKRACVRRQSARLKSEEAENADELCEIPDAKFAVCPPPTETVQEDGVATSLTTIKNECKEGNAAIGHEQGRPSIGRPSRVAANKVKSYKEIPLGMKMRRPD